MIVFALIIFFLVGSILDYVIGVYEPAEPETFHEWLEKHQGETIVRSDGKGGAEVVQPDIARDIFYANPDATIDDLLQ